MQNLIWILLCLFAAIGIIQAAGWAVCKIIKPQNNSTVYYIIPVEEDPKAIEAQLRYNIMRRNWSRESCWGGELLLLLDLGLCDECAEICRRMAQSTDGVFVCKPDDIKTLVTRLEGLRKSVGNSL